MNVLILGGAGPAGMNFARAIEMSGRYTPIILDSNRYHLEFAKAEGFEWVLYRGVCDRKAIEHYARETSADLVYAQPDVLVPELARANVPKMVPSLETIKTCQFKPQAVAIWEEAGLRPRKEGWDFPMWLRPASGAGGMGAVRVDSQDERRKWMESWPEVTHWSTEPYLEGRNLAWTSVWKDGELSVSTLRERMQMHYPHLTRSGLTGTPSVTRSVVDEAVNRAAYQAVRAIDACPHGVYCVDLIETHPTEINIGRFFTISLFAACAGANLPAHYCDLATGTATEYLPPFNAVEPGWYWIRHMDCGPVLVREEDMT